MQCIKSTKPPSNVILSTLLTGIADTYTASHFFSSIRDSQHAPSYRLESQENAHCVWRRNKLTPLEFNIYAFIVPILGFFGLCTNFINYIVFMRPKMTPSAFSYLAVLSLLDCISCVLLTLTSLSRSFLYDSIFWMAYDFQWQTPLFGITTGAANLILACVSLDRFIYLRLGIPNGTPKFCSRGVARRMIMVVILLSIMINMPYFWVFVVNDDGTFETTDFYFSNYYKAHNWFTFIFLTILPAIFLMIGNAAIFIAFREWTKQSRKCQSDCSNPNSKNVQNRYKHQMKLTITIITVITLYLVGELPAHLTSRKSVLNLLYNGDVNKVNFKVMQRLEVIFITLNALQLSANIIVYAVINPTFLPEFFNCLKETSDTCIRFMGFLAVGTCWRKVCNSNKTNQNTNCINEDNNRQDPTFYGINCADG